ncbi:MAG: hypothetical protein LLG09_05020 [Negativicutes bacterium]|nr:hypothetical protein [Negativicutes bacterium]
MKQKKHKKGIALLEAILSLALVGFLLIPIFLLNNQSNQDLRTAFSTEQTDRILRSALEEFYAFSAASVLQQIDASPQHQLIETEITATAAYRKIWQILEVEADGNLVTLRLRVAQIGGVQEDAETSLDFFYSP